MNARHDPSLTAGGEPSEQEVAEFFQFAELQEAEGALRAGILRRDPEAIRIVRELADALSVGPIAAKPYVRPAPPPMPADGEPPF